MGIALEQPRFMRRVQISGHTVGVTTKYSSAVTLPRKKCGPIVSEQKNAAKNTRCGMRLSKIKLSSYLVPLSAQNRQLTCYDSSPIKSEGAACTPAIISMVKQPSKEKSFRFERLINRGMMAQAPQEKRRQLSDPVVPIDIPFWLSFCCK